jgi:hypothetical protein
MENMFTSDNKLCLFRRYCINQILLPRLESLHDIVEFFPISFKEPILSLQLVNRSLSKQLLASVCTNR